MYQKKETQIQFENFHTPFGGKIRSDNRWVILSKLIPWDEAEEKYAANFTNSLGAPAKPVRMALGSLIIKERCGFSDEELVEQIRENHYFQYFIGLPEYQDKIPFDPSMMVYFRKRLGMEIVNEINERICIEEKKHTNKDDNDNNASPTVKKQMPNENHSENENKGTLIIDATCAPSDIKYPTDLNLLNEAREKLEGIIDTLHEPEKGKAKKPRTYRIVARRAYLKTAKNKKPSRKEIRKAIKKQLNFVRRDLAIIAKQTSSLKLLSRKQQEDLAVIRELFYQQKQMYEQNENRIDDRIVSISQPYVRPIVRGKVSAETEFGPKISISLIDGYVFLDKLSWNNYNEGVCFKEHIEAYYRRFGYYPKAVIVDKIYRNRENIKYCREHGIRLSGPPLGRPREEEQARRKQQEREDVSIRNSVEGKFGEGKRAYGLGRIRAKLQETSESVVAIQFLVMNLQKKLRFLFIYFFKLVFKVHFHRFSSA